MEQVKEYDYLTPENPVRNSFFLRCAILVASEKSGFIIDSWKAFTHPIPMNQNSENIWPWLENPVNWMPEAQGINAKYIEQSWIQALELAKEHPDQHIVAYKGGFGAGKTFHSKLKFGEQFRGIIAPDVAKKALRKALPISHSTAHIQTSGMAYNLFNNLINSPISTAVYDSSLSMEADVSSLLIRASRANKPLKIVDVTRKDIARILAILARGIEGVDPRPPLSYITFGAQRDRKERPKCMNIVLESDKIEMTHLKSGEQSIVPHTYELYCGNAQGADSQLICVLKSGKLPEWNDKIDFTEIQSRLASEGIRFNVETSQFELVSSCENWQKKLVDTLKQPASLLIKGLSESEAENREKVFKSRILVFDKIPDLRTPSNLYECLIPEIRDAITAEAFIKSFDTLDFKRKQKVINQFISMYESGKHMSYMELPVTMAIELHKCFRFTPRCWRTNHC